jgi:FAD/FMN-containing dehydrogenase
MQEHTYESIGPYSYNTTLACDIATPYTVKCDQGNVPLFSIAVSQDEDIVQGLDFALKHNLRTIVKNAGHDLLGRSIGADCLLVWTPKLKSITIEDKFIPSGCSASQSFEAVRLGAGVQWQEAYNAVGKVGRVVVGGISANGTVGAAGGWLAGGGHSILSPSYGLGVDNATQLRVVLPSTSNNQSERAIEVSRCSHPDLFWALRGGGGGTYGVVTEVVYRTHRDSAGLAVVFTGVVNDTKTYAGMADTYLRAAPSLADQRWGGYSYLIGANKTVEFVLYRANATDANEEAKLNATANALLGSLQQISQSPTPSGVVLSLPNFQALLSLLNGQGGDARSQATQRRLLQGESGQVKPVVEPMLYRNLSKRQLRAQDVQATHFGASRLLPRQFFEGNETRAKLVEYSTNSIVEGLCVFFFLKNPSIHS